MGDGDIYNIHDLARESGLSVGKVKIYLGARLIRPTGRNNDGSLSFDDVAVKRLKTIKKIKKGGTSFEQLKRMMEV